MAGSGVLVGRGYVSIRPEFEGDWSRSVNSRASSAGRSGASAFSKAFGVGLKGIGALAGVAIGANLASAAAGAAVLAPALATAGAAAGALKIGLSGVSDAFKAAFADSTADANAAASATKAVESAQRGLANAQRALADARVQAARQVADAQKQVVSAERDLSDAQREARDVQADLNSAREDAARALEDMNQRLAESQLDERDAVLRLKDAQAELKAAQSKPGTTPEELAKLQLAYDRAALNLKEQRTETGRLTEDTKKANKAGVEGSAQVVEAKQKIADANRNVADKEQALADAQAGVVQAQQDGARQIQDAQRGVAEAAQALADAQAAAASQTSKLDQAMAKLAPNAQSFVRTIQGLAPAWDSLRLSVQNRLFEGLDSTVAGLARTTLPVLKEQLTGTAGIWNAIAKNAASGVQEMSKSGMLRDILKGANANLAVFKNTPKQLITAFGQLTVAAQPAFNGLLTQFAGAITHFTDGLAASFKGGGLEDAINTAFGILSSFGTLLGNALGVVTQIFKAASDAGGQIVGVLGTVLGELKTILAAPEMQAALKTLFTSVAQIVTAIVPVIGSAVQAVLPLVAALAPTIAQLAQTLGPVLQQVVTSLGQALMPVIQALGPVVAIVGDAIGRIVTALLPLLQPIGDLIAAIVSALLPVLGPIVGIVVQLVKILVGPLTQVIRLLIPYFGLLGQVFGKVFGALLPIVTPLIGIITQLAGVFVTLAQLVIGTLMRAITPLIPVFVQIVGLVVQLATQVLASLMPSINQLITAGMQLLVALLPLLPSLTQVAAIVLTLAVNVLSHLLPPLIRLAAFIQGTMVAAFVMVIGWITKVIKVVGQLVSAIARNLGPAFQWLNDKVVQPVWRAIQNGISTVWRVGIKPVFDALRKAVGLVADSFVKARDGIKTAWDKLADIAKKPIKFVIDTVYNGGIVKVWNKIASAFGADKLSEFHPKGFASGGIMPGYTPGRDVHRFLSPTGGALELSGGEAIMRPEFTRAVGGGFVSYFNRLAKSSGTTGVRRELAPLLGGNPRTPTDHTLRYADGGIFGWIKSAASTAVGAGSAAWNGIKKGASWLTDTLEASARAGVNKVVNPLLKNFPGADTGFGKMIRRIPTKILDALFGYSKEADKRGGGGIGGPRIQAALKWARTQNGLPYQWGGNGNPSWDCSGLMSAIESVIRGQKPHRRWATGAFSGKTAPPGWVLHGNSPFRIGITNAGVGHTAGTLGGVNVESRGGDGVVVGKRARGYNDKLFTSWYGFQPGKYDAGGFLQPGFTLAYNGTGRPEPVLTGSQFNAIARSNEPAGLQPGDTLTLRVEDHDFTAYIDGRADGRVQAGHQRLISVINAS